MSFVYFRSYLLIKPFLKYILYSDIDYCGNNLCQNNAICIPDVVGQNYTCGCTNGFYGDLCQYGILFNLVKLRYAYFFYLLLL